MLSSSVAVASSAPTTSSTSPPCPRHCLERKLQLAHFAVPHRLEKGLAPRAALLECAAQRRTRHHAVDLRVERLAAVADGLQDAYLVRLERRLAVLALEGDALIDQLEWEGLLVSSLFGALLCRQAVGDGDGTVRLHPFAVTISYMNSFLSSRRTE